ncbi:MAG TPA: hypothetical protein VIV60_16835, partial [Polyangiaceae bacterium]
QSERCINTGERGNAIIRNSKLREPPTQVTRAGERLSGCVHGPSEPFVRNAGEWFGRKARWGS